MARLQLSSCSVFVLIACWIFLLNPTPTEETVVGAPLAACTTMTPGHNTAPQASPSIYKLDVERLTADTLSVTINRLTGAGYKGFLIQARRDGSDVPIGTFLGPIPSGTKTLRCSGPDDSVTHSNNAIKDSTTFTWRQPPGSLVGTRFWATTCLDYLTFWVKYTSIDLGGV